MLTSSAFNAFLKTLEEPPSHAIFILATTEKHKIIPTILSRCQIFDFNRIKIEDIVSRLMFVAKKENIIAEEEALHIIGQKADGALRDALSIFDQIVSLSGKTITYKDVIENLNVLDYEYYFKCIEAALSGDVSSMLLTFNEILEKGFDGHNFISGINSHLRDLLVSKDQSTIKLLETTPSVRQRYLQQTEKCSVDFLFKALETGTNCDLTYKSSKNQRLHVELSLIRLCMLTAVQGAEVEKKNPDQTPLTIKDKDQPIPAKSEISGKESHYSEKETTRPENIHSKQVSVADKQSKAFSIKEVISDDNKPIEKSGQVNEPVVKEAQPRTKAEFTPEAFEAVWNEFVQQLQGDGTRIVSMFKAIKTEVDDDKTVKIHLSNTDQKDIFILNYKQKLLNFLENKLITAGLDIETIVDMSQPEDILYSDDQKNTYLLKKYPILKEMKKNFNLDIN